MMVIICNKSYVLGSLCTVFEIIAMTACEKMLIFLLTFYMFQFVLLRIYEFADAKKRSVDVIWLFLGYFVRAVLFWIVLPAYLQNLREKRSGRVPLTT